MARVAAQYAYMVSSDFESPEARYALGPYTPVDPMSVRRAVQQALTPSKRKDGRLWK